MRAKVLRMKILYLSCHAALEYDELSLLHACGHEVFSPGIEPEPFGPYGPGSLPFRPAVEGLSHDVETARAWARVRAGVAADADPKRALTREFVARFDVVIVMHTPFWVYENLEACEGVPLVWRTIGQSGAKTERLMRTMRECGVTIARYSPAERFLPDYAGADAVLRFTKSPDEFGGWHGTERCVVTFAQTMRHRREVTGFDAFDAATRGFERRLYGFGNDDVDWARGSLAYDAQLEVLRASRVYFAAGTRPASYTLGFLEAWMTGVPVVALGRKLAGPRAYPNVYEVPDLIEHGVDGFCSDDIDELRDCIEQLLDDDGLARRIGRAGRESAVTMFGRDTVRPDWDAMFDRLQPVRAVRSRAE